MHSVHILSNCQISRAINENERRPVRERHCRHAATQSLWTLCHSWRSIVRALMCLHSSLRPSAAISTAASSSVHQLTAPVLSHGKLSAHCITCCPPPPGLQSLRCLAKAHPSIFHVHLHSHLQTIQNCRLASPNVRAFPVWQGARVPGENRHRQAPGPGIKPASLLLRCDSTNHCTAMMPLLQFVSFVVHCRCIVY